MNYSGNYVNCPKCGQPVEATMPCCPKCYTSLSGWTPPGPQGTGAYPDQPSSVWELRVHGFPPGREEQVISALSEVLKISTEKARWRLAQPGRLVATNMSNDALWALKTRLEQVNATVMYKFVPASANPFAGEPEDPLPPTPPVEPARMIRWAARPFAQPASLAPYSVAGLSLGHRSCSIAFTSADRGMFLGPPRLLTFNGAPVLPAAYYSDGLSERFGREALKLSVAEPARVRSGFFDMPEQPENERIVLSFLRYVRARLDMVSGLDPDAPLPVVVGMSRGMKKPGADALYRALEQAGFQLTWSAPNPLAVVSALNLSSQGSAAQAQGQAFYLVVDAGSTDTRVSVIERTANGEMAVINHVCARLGGDSIDALLLDWVKSKLPAGLNDRSMREIALMIPEFKVQMSLSFGQANSEYMHNFMLAEKDLPLYVTIRRAEFEEMLQPQLKELSEALRQAPGQCGLMRQHVRGVLLAGGSANLYFLPPAIQQSLGFTPAAEAKPEETIARGLAVYGLMPC